MLSRPGNNLVARFPDLVESLRTVLNGPTVILDGEIVVLGKDGRAERRCTRELPPLSGQ
jgi:ATP-dependent DNA ligase